MLLIQGDCLHELKDIASGSVDMVLADPPYGTQATWSLISAWGVAGNMGLKWMKGTLPLLKIG